MYTLMIVDDEPAILEGISRLIDWKGLGFERIRMAKNAYEAVEHVIDWKPDVCLVDVCLEDVFGYNLISRFHEMGVKSNYIMMSGHNEFSYACEALRCGVLDYLLKPVDGKQLQSRMEQIIVECLHGSLPEKKKENEDPILKQSYKELSPLIRKVAMIVGMEFGKRISLKSIADRFRMNSTYLGQIFIRETGMKFSEYLMAYRMQEARKRILDSDDKIIGIANDIGYTNLNYFYQHFHNFYGVTPSEMRETRG